MTEELTLDKAIETLRMMRRNAPHGEVAIQSILFGIKYHDELRHLRIADISSGVGVGPNTCGVEIRHGMNLAKYVDLKKGDV